MLPEAPLPPPSDSPDLDSWLEAHDLVAASLSPLGGDVSPRTYARVTGRDGSSWILASYPPELSGTFERFRRTTELLETAGVRVPAIRTADEASLRMVVEDLGPQTLYERPERSWPAWTADYRTACTILGRISALPAGLVTDLNPLLDGMALRRELEQTLELFVRPLRLPPALEARLVGFFDQLCEAIDGQPRHPCHRDFMVRNLVPTATGLAVIDHQDLRLAPERYDLASLLNDSVFPPAQIEEAILDEVLGTGAPRDDYRRCAVQRTFKAIGTFTAFARRGFPRHLPLVSPTLERGLAQMAQLDEGAALAGELRRAFTPAQGISRSLLD
ncbi:MAG: phosphotransferase [Acidobacteria bacterium]|nr:phosphotransferase [Acidobacteriota bacterium]